MMKITKNDIKEVVCLFEFYFYQKCQMIAHLFSPRDFPHLKICIRPTSGAFIGWIYTDHTNQTKDDQTNQGLNVLGPMSAMTHVLN